MLKIFIFNALFPAFIRLIIKIKRQYVLEFNIKIIYNQYVYHLVHKHRYALIFIMQISVIPLELCIIFTNVDNYNHIRFSLLH